MPNAVCIGIFRGLINELKNEQMKLKKYRIVRDSYAGYEAQVWRIWFPFWVQLGGGNTHTSADQAEHYIRSRPGSFVRYVDIEEKPV